MARMMSVSTVFLVSVNVLGGVERSGWSWPFLMLYLSPWNEEFCINVAIKKECEIKILENGKFLNLECLDGVITK